jgi:hypothetical protein
MTAGTFPLQNLEFIEGRFDCDAVRARLCETSFVIALHACTEANGAAIEMAVGAGAMWGVMPCCMRTVACFPDGCQLVRCPDDTRHALLCGSLVERYHAALVVSIDKRITTRHVVICGGVATAGAAEPARPVLYHIAGKAEKARYPDYYQVRPLPAAAATAAAATDGVATPLPRNS